jgi:mevalonate kinase
MVVTATAPAKAILLGEHAVNRGAAALAVSVGRYATCMLSPTGAGDYQLVGGGREQKLGRAEVLAFGATIDAQRAAEEYAAIEALAAADFFAPHKYVLAGFGEALPAQLHASFTSDIPPSAGLGSGGACFVALAAALAAQLDLQDDPRRLAELALRGDIVAHGGIASGLDSQTSLYGGAIRYTAQQQGAPIPYAQGISLVVGHSGVIAATSEVNGRVRRWLAERPLRMHYFAAIGLLSRHAEQALRTGDWPELGRLLNLNQLILERIGVSCPELEALNEAALGAGALGAKLSGSGGGGIMLALVEAHSAAPVAEAIRAAGGEPILAPIGVAGVRVEGPQPRRSRSSAERQRRPGGEVLDEA